MKKILTREERNKKARRNQLIIGIVLVGLMILSSAGYAFQGDFGNDENEKVSYNGVEFVRDSSGYWKFNLNGNDFFTLYNPKEVQEFNSLLKLSSYYNKPLYFAGNSEGVAEIARNLEGYALRLQNACIDEEDCEGDLPIKKCSEDNIIIFKEDESERIYQEENCIFIIANSSNQARFADAVLFDILNI